MQASSRPRQLDLLASDFQMILTDGFYCGETFLSDSCVLCEFKITGSGGIRTHASEETGVLNQRLRPLGHATHLLSSPLAFLANLDSLIRDSSSQMLLQYMAIIILPDDTAVSR